MKILCEVTSVSTTGDGLRIGLQGKPPAAAGWRPDEHQEIVIPASGSNNRTFYVGRIVMIEITAR